MASDLYEVLGLDKSASPEQIRKAYKKKALATHPDRLPPNVSEEEKQQANERFRLANNAYEVLIDPNNRKLYDQHGVWPPPTAMEEPPTRSTSAHDPFGGRGPLFDSDPFVSRHRPMHGFAFTDPFELFNSLFGDIRGTSHVDPFHNAFSVHNSPFDLMFGPSVPRSHPHDFFGHSAMSPFGLGFPLGSQHPLLEIMNSGMGNSANVRSYSSMSQTMDTGREWISQSIMTRTINGRTETITKRQDAQGNEHVTYSSPEGERYTLNGIDQPVPDDRYLSRPGSHPAVASPSPAAASGSSRHDRSQAQPITINFNAPYETGFAAVPQPEASRHRHSSSRHRHHSTHEAHRPRGLDDDAMRRSSSSRQHSDGSQAAAPYQDPSQYYGDAASRRKTSSRPPHPSHHSHAHMPYSEPLRPEPTTSHGVGSSYRQQFTPFADPTPQSHGVNYGMDGQALHAHTHASHRPPDRDERHRHGNAERQDEHYRRNWWNGAHGW
ncbi:hypothetical protein PHLGIDRAFT_34116 [Phlebiopsis gigantea 11061_1 CR5-6]|uniref:J domain-containing protein n=1 Tax=Phlebiopsis gigantea (strain 11061_1 CR5-6) TaxID=745531 RepID=A0A0C3NX49_PHLG1|nr:hypothetical protein PHLGIDRAFT_34116 [Phlebiopsis gigantea 11061_1 CR5-6]